MKDNNHGFEYSLQLSKEQAAAISFSTEIVARIYVGQLDEILRVLSWRAQSLSYEEYDEVRSLLKRASDILMNDASTYGIGHSAVPERAKTLWDLHQVIRHRTSWDEHPEGGFQVWFDKPLKTSTENLASIQKALQRSMLCNCGSGLERVGDRGCYQCDR